MSKRRMPLLAAFVAAFALLGLECIAQSDVDERLSSLESQVKRLLEENGALRDQMSMGGGGEQSEIGQAIADYMETNNVIAVKTSEPGVQSLTFNGEARTRFDGRTNTGDLRDDIDDDGLRLDFRFNLGFKFVFEDDDIPARVTTYVEIQAAGRGSNNTAENISSNAATGTGAGGFESRSNELDEVRLYQAWILLEDILSVDGLSLKFGRQELKYGSQLILGVNSFFTGTTHDAIRVDYGIDSINGSVSFFYAKEGAPDGQLPATTSSGGLFTGRFRASGDEDEMLGLYGNFNTNGDDPFQFDAYWVYFNARSASRTSPGVNLTPNNVTAAADSGIDNFGRSVIGGRTHTIGAWVRKENLFTEGLYVSAEFAYQFGKDEGDQDLDAWIAEFAAEYAPSFLSEVQGAFYVRYYFAQGPSGGESQGFTPLFNSRHDNQPYDGHGAFSRLGNIDFIPASNVHVFQIGFKFSPSEKWILGITYLYAVLDESETPLTFVPNGALFADDDNLGHEIDVYARYEMSANTIFFFNVSVFIPTFDFFEADPATNASQNPNGFRQIDSDVAFGAYAQIRVTF
ncbi:MAG: hypothetical protein ACI97A_002017 [Planctomycetota bacterium]|jgi:hypothetical protein